MGACMAAHPFHVRHQSCTAPLLHGPAAAWPRCCTTPLLHGPIWKDVLEPLRSEQEVFRRFNAERVPSELLTHVRLAARSRINSIHVTALVLAENGHSFYHYDNDSASRQRGTADVVSLRAAWGPFTLWALLPGTSPLCAAIDALPPAHVWVT